MDIDLDSYKLPEKNYYGSVYTKKQIVIGHTGRLGMLHYKSWVNRINGGYLRSSAFTVDRDGKVYQHYDPKYYTLYINKYHMSPFVIPITLVNVGWVSKNPNGEGYFDWLGNIHELDESELTNKEWRGKKLWVNYTKEQLTSLKKLTDKLCGDFNIKEDCMPHTIFNEDVDIYEGITFKSNYYQEVTDISPAFDMGIFKIK